jgi:hypothetical protein
MLIAKEREITRDDYIAIKEGKKSIYEFFDICERCGYGVYGATAIQDRHNPDRYYIAYDIGSSCD